MNKKICGIIIISIVIFMLFFMSKEGQVIDKSDLSLFNIIKVNNIVNKENASEKAEAINTISDETISDIVISEVLDSYYAEDNVDTEAVEEFSITLNQDISDNIQEYEDAKAERDNADNLDYQIAEIIINVSEKATEEEIDTMIRTVSDSYEVISDDGTLIKVNIDLDQTTSKAIEEFEEYDIVEDASTNDYGTLDTLTKTLTDSQAANEWYLDTCNFEGAWNIVESQKTTTVGSNSASSAEKTPIIVAVIDNGFYINHYDIDDVIIDAVDITQTTNNGEYLKLKNSSNPLSTSTSHHGTFISSIIAGETNNWSIAGAGSTAKNLINLITIKAYNSQGVVTPEYFYKAVQYAINNGAKVISCSISWSNENATLKKAITLAETNGVVLVCSAGNENTTEYRYPSGYDSVISVGATNSSNEKAGFSTYGQAVNIVAPGVNIYGAYISGVAAYIIGSGTSYSTPLVAATAALMLEVNPNLSPSEIRQILYETSSEIGTHTWKYKRTETNYCYICGEYTTLNIYVCKDSNCIGGKKFVGNCGHTYFEYSDFGCGLLNAKFATEEALNEK